LENGNLKSEVSYKKSYGLGWKKVKTTLIPHGIAKEYYENGRLKKKILM
jgi:antitoxin component YwqK of YwqJK toxin-antitoxin module